VASVFPSRAATQHTAKRRQTKKIPTAANATVGINFY